MFRGRYVHTLDSKNRMSLPVEYRQQLERKSERPPILTNALECLELYPYEDWEEFEEEIVRRARVNTKTQAYVRWMVSGACECPIDKQGRILVPPHLRKHAQLERDVTVAGVGVKIELWNTERFEADLLKTQAGFPDMATAMDEKLEN